MTPEVALTFSGLFTIIVTIVMTALGWRVKSSQDDKIASLNSELEAQLHARKLSFEKEFETLSNLWAAFVDLRDATPDDPTAFAGADAQAQQRRIDQFNKFKSKREALMNVFELNRPFYPQEIYEIVKEFLGRALLKSEFTVNYEIMHVPPLGYSAIMGKNREEILVLNERLCDAIRKHLYNARI